MIMMSEQKTTKGKLKLNKVTKNDLITYLMVVTAYVIVEILLKTGNLSSLLQGLLVPLCTYVILAVSLNLTVGILGELSLGHAGFMCIGAFSSALFSLGLKDSIANEGVRFFFAILIAAACAALCGILVGIPVLRLKGDYLSWRGFPWRTYFHEGYDGTWTGAGWQGTHQRCTGHYRNTA